MKILMVAAENGALSGGKVGGLGDVLRDVPRALSRAGHDVSVVMPGYQRFSTLPGASYACDVKVDFSGRQETVSVYRLQTQSADENVTLWILDHPGFAPCGPGVIYCDDPEGSPFARDAQKFALFSVAVTKALLEGKFGECDVIHLHDWHTALVAVLMKYHTSYRSLSRKRLVFTIHNLGLQGVRPLRGHSSALETWFPDLDYDTGVIDDPRYPDTFNPMRAAINLCDKIHTVSPTYASEIQRASQPEKGFYGGEGLEKDLQAASREKRLVGILNGCEYPKNEGESVNFPSFVNSAMQQILAWAGRDNQVSSAYFIASHRIREWSARQDIPFVLSAIGRLTDQKMQLFTVELADGRTTLAHFLDKLPSTAVFIVLGSGSPELEDFFTTAAGQHNNLLFLKGYSEVLASQLYGLGELFIMPSSYEPCGISQMLAMRQGQPCLVHAVGGLTDTVQNNVNGFSFSGESIPKQAENLVEGVERALVLKREHPQQWRLVKNNAAATRFEWGQVADRYSKDLYLGQ